MFKSIHINFFLLIMLFACSENKDPMPEKYPDPIRLTLLEANRLAELPLHCIQVEYPNKLNQTLENENYLKEPNTLHPAFYGCFDWHSSVHGHWMLVSLLKQFPALENREEIKKRLLENLSADNIRAEVEYFFQPQNSSFERTYGWAWILKLAEELHTWDDPLARELETNLMPLTDLMVTKYLDFLPKLIYPIRVGEHSNIAFGLSLAYDYALAVNHIPLQDIIEQRARDWFIQDTNCPLDWEPSGFDFLSPCFQEMDIMRKVLEEQEFKDWLNQFMPKLADSDFFLEPGKVSDRSDGKLVHLDGLNFSRAWCIYGLIDSYPNEYGHLIEIANEHIQHSLPSIVDDHYEGTHWLGSFAVYALQKAP